VGGGNGNVGMGDAKSIGRGALTLMDILLTDVKLVDKAAFSLNWER